MENAIKALLPASYPWKNRLICLPEVDSTNSRLKELARQGAPHGTVLIAGCQTGGRGRLGRGFSSPEGMGVYFSMLLRPDCPPQALMHLTCAVGVAMCDAVERIAGFRPGIKWTNDLVWGRKKLGGILVELGLDSGGRTDYAIAGIGINCHQQIQDFPQELRDKAASLEMAAGRPVSRDALAASMAQCLYEMDCSLFSGKEAMLARYRRDCVTIGKEISLIRGEEVRRGAALDVDGLGALVVRYPDGTVEHVNSGEVSVRGMYGYADP